MKKKRNGSHHVKEEHRGSVEDREEYSAEVAPGAWVEKDDMGRTAREDADAGAGVSLGWIALVFAIASLFFWPVIMGPTAGILGFYAYQQGQRGLGSWSMILGGVAFFVFAFFIR
ncbi:hypothetical protein [Paenibacillus terrigena]|uniref:hypothetical protein n=1 Tax=Paenibacillus terrigena TaxID=369333 RepID=UPI0003622D81|nr:hypothetical protein [Paenibacillus terrigena]